MSRRKSHLAKRLQKMRGLDMAEKALLVRVGETIDSIINNRAPTNPFESGRTRDDRRLPPPKVITHEPGVRSAKLSWDAVNSSILSHYKITITNLDTGTEEVFTSFTNAFFFKGRIGGNYKAKVASVGRGGIESRVLAQEDFLVTEDVMLIEGAKNSFNAVSATVSEDIFHTRGHKVFVWGAYTIDKLIGGADSGNSIAAMRLYRAEKGDPISQATLLEEVTVYAATESATCIDVDALGGNIERPALESPADTDPDFLRGTSYETAHSLMFSPVVVTDDIDEREFTYFVEIVGRETENDITGLSMVIWAGNEGLAAQLPSDPIVREPAIVTQDKKSIEIHPTLANPDTGKEWIHGTITAPFRSVADVWTFGCWVKWLRMPSISRLVTRWEPIPPDNSINFNAFRITVNRQVVGGGTERIQTVIVVGDKDGNVGSWTRNNNYDLDPGDGSQDPDNDPEGKYTGGNILWPFGLGEWHLIFVRFDPANGVVVYSNGGNLIGATLNNTGGIEPDNTGPSSVVFGGEGASVYSSGIFDGPTANITSPAPVRLHSAGIWNTRLSPSEMTALYNGGDGVNGPLGDDIHWRNNYPLWPIPYLSGGSLVHYWQFGAVDSELQYVGRDTGINPLASGGADGDIDLTNEGQHGEDFTLDNVINEFPETGT